MADRSSETWGTVGCVEVKVGIYAMVFTSTVGYGEVNAITPP